jgi:hypothetical protein
LCVTAVLCLCATVLGATADAIVVVVRVAAGIRRDLVDDALREAARLYRRGGLSIRFVDARHDAIGALWLTVLQHDDFRVDGVESRLGIAPRGGTSPGRLAYVFARPVENLAYRSGADPALVLGAAIAHELAHLLLSTGRHSPEGLMQVRWGAREAAAAGRGELHFSDEELADIRAHLPAVPLELARAAGC